MIYLPFIVIIVIALIYFLYKSDQIATLKRDGVKVVGVIVHNNDGPESSQFRLGGNINNPTVTFVTTEGNEIIGTPVNTFVTQFEIVVPLEVQVIYDPKNPEKFFVDFE